MSQYEFGTIHQSFTVNCWWHGVSHYSP